MLYLRLVSIRAHNMCYLQNFARGYFLKFSLRALHLDDALDLRAANCLDPERNLEAYFFVWSSQVKIKVYRNFRACRGK